MKLFLVVATMLVVGSAYGEDCGDGTVQAWEQCGMSSVSISLVLFYKNIFLLVLLMHASSLLAEPGDVNKNDCTTVHNYAYDYFVGGTLGCYDWCEFDVSNCIHHCGDGTIQSDYPYWEGKLQSYGCACKVVCLLTYVVSTSQLVTPKHPCQVSRPVKTYIGGGTLEEP